jgi:nucleotide-binding universal stress UspA family protein
MYRKILLANDGSANARGALEPAIALARVFDAKLEMFVVIGLPRIPALMMEVDEARAAAETKSSYIISVAQHRAEAANVTFQSERAIGDFVVRTLAFINKNHHDLLVIGSDQPHTMFANATDRLLLRAPCSVHLVKS